jgi:phage FluMu gp28-like protein
MARKATYWYIAPFYGEAKETVWLDTNMFPKYCPPEIWQRRNNTELYIPFPNGSMLYVKGADKPDNLRGSNPEGVVLDENGTMKPEVWSAIIQPVMTANPHSWAWFVGTPNGKNDLYAKYQMAKDNPNYYSSILRASESGIIRPEDLEEARKTTPEQWFRQEYECDFLEQQGSIFRRVREQIRGDLEEAKAGRNYIMGVDLAKYTDYTVIAVVDRHTHCLVYFDRFNQLDWSLQKARIEAVSRRYNNCPARIDSTGVGDPICEDLEKTGVMVYPYKFTQESKRELVENLSIKIENGHIFYPNIPEMIAELEAFTYDILPSGKVRYEAPSGKHDDCVMALALAYYDIGVKLQVVTADDEYGQVSEQFDPHAYF